MYSCTGVEITSEHGARWLVFSFDVGSEYDILLPDTAQGLSRLLLHLREKCWFTAGIEFDVLAAISGRAS